MSSLRSHEELKEAAAQQAALVAASKGESPFEHPPSASAR
jgi:hypothetical protein